MHQFLQHVAGNDAFRRMGKMNIPFSYERTDAVIDGPGGDSRLHHQDRTVIAGFQNRFTGRDDIFRIDLAGLFQVGCRYRNDIYVRNKD